MFFVPYSTELKLNQIPYITYSVILICILVFVMQFNNNTEISKAAKSYCNDISKHKISSRDADVLGGSFACRNMLSTIHVYYRDDESLETYINRNFSYYFSEKNDVILFKKHYENFSEYLEPSLNQYLMYYPDSWNPWKMITSTLSHSDIWHIAFNLLFFIAFTPVLEILINNKFQFIKVLLVITFSTGITYSIFSIGSQPVPSLGLSGVVMGMIGLAGYLMPKAKIRVFFWFIVFFKTFFIPAWILAAWYIGWDIWELFNSGNSGGINLVAHVSGGVTGYLLGVKFFKERRDDYKYELDDAIDESRYQRKDKIFKVSSKGEREDYSNKLLIKTANREYEDNFSRVYEYVIADRDSDAVMLLLNDDSISTNVEAYEDIFERVSQWQPSRTLLCMGRIVLHLLITHHKFDRAIEYTKRCQKISEGFVLSSVEEMLLLAQYAINSQHYDVAYSLVRDAEQRYHGEFDLVHCQFLEIKLLWLHLEQYTKSKELMKLLLSKNPIKHRTEIMQLAALMHKPSL